MQFTERISRLGAGIFSELLEVKNEKLGQGGQVINLSVDAPNILPAEHIRQALCEMAMKPEDHIYAINDRTGLLEAVAEWYQRQYGVRLDTGAKICSLLGSREGLTHTTVTVIDQGDAVLMSNPCYPVFGDDPLLAGAELYHMPQKRENGYIIRSSEIPENVARRAKLMVMSYPNNPTTVMALDSFYEELIVFAEKYEVIMFHNNAYSELVFDRRTCGSFLRFPGTKDMGVEFNSLSRTYGLAGARTGFCMGNVQVVAQLKNLESNTDYGMFLPIQQTAITAIAGDQGYVAVTRRAYERRRDVLCDGLKEVGWETEKLETTMFAWARIPDHYKKSEDFVMDLVEKADVLVAPRGAFRPFGEGHVRLVLVKDGEEFNKAVETIRRNGTLEGGQHT